MKQALQLKKRLSHYIKKLALTVGCLGHIRLDSRHQKFERMEMIYYAHINHKSWSGSPNALLFYCCATNCHKFNSLKQYPFTSSRFYRSQEQAGSLLRSWKAKIKVLAKLASNPKALGKISFQNNNNLLRSSKNLLPSSGCYKVC